MKKWNLKSYLCGVITSALILGLCIPTLAATVQKQMTVTYKDIKIFVDGEEIIPKDVNGNVVEPFVSNGTTYLPVRAVGEALGKNVEWNGDTNSVYIGAASSGSASENIISITDVAVGNAEKDYVDSVNANTQVVPTFRWIKPMEVSKVVSKIGIDKIMQNQSATSTVTELEVLQYCMPSIPDDFVTNPVPGTYDGIRVDVQDGEIVLAYEDLVEKGFV